MDLKSCLLRVMDHKDHWAWPVFGGSTATPEQLRIHFQQEYGVYVRDFPVFLSRIHARCPEAEVRRDLAENLYEEETGGLSGTGPHPDLFLYMMEGLGFERAGFRDVGLLPASQRYRQWLDEATMQADWVVAAAVIAIFVEGSVHDRREISRPADAGDSSEDALLRDNPLVKYHRLDPRYLKLKRAHAKVEGGHRQAAWRMVLEHAGETSVQRECTQALERSLELWLAYRDAVAGAAGIESSGRRSKRRITLES